jgi:hypothetical protein
MRSIKQTGCSRKRSTMKRSTMKRSTMKRKQRGGDAYNTIPARSIYPLHNYEIDPQRMMRISGGTSKMRKYLYR